MRLSPGTWRLRIAWWTHVAVATGFGLLGGLLAVLVGVVVVIDARTVTACEAASAAPPDFAAPPFAYDPEARAGAFVRAMANDEFQAAYEMLASEQFGHDSACVFDLEGFWRQVSRSSDARLISVSQSDQASFVAMYNRLDVPLRLIFRSAQEHRDVRITVRLLADGRVAGQEIDWVLTEADTDRPTPTPAYAKPDTFEEMEVLLGQAPWELKGTITIPVGTGPFPAVVTNGGESRDGIGPSTKLARDRAWGLATLGVASLRFDRRTRTYALAMARQEAFTVNHELVDDTLAAVEILRRTPRIDPGRIYVLGGSLAGFAAPMVGLRDSNIAGLIIVAAPSGMLHDLLWRGPQFHLSLDGEVTPYDRRVIRASRNRTEAISAWVTSGKAPQDLSVHRSYYAHLGTYRPEDAAYRLLMPILVVSADWDRIVPPEDANTWFRSLRLRRNVAFRLYHGHGHAMIDERDRTGSSSLMNRHASWEVISDIAGWIHGDWSDRSCMDLEAWYAGCRAG